MVGRIVILIVATIVMAGGLPRAGVALPIAPLNKIQTGELNNVTEVAARKDASRKTTVSRRTTVRRGPNSNVKRTTVTKRANGNVRRNVYVNRNVNVRRTVIVHRPYRAWVRRPYYGAIVGGVALGTVVGVGAAYAVPIAPAPNMCWYWSDRTGLYGYWDYCVAP